MEKMRGNIEAVLKKQIVNFLCIYLIIDSINGILLRSSLPLSFSLSQVFKAVLLAFMAVLILFKLQYRPKYIAAGLILLAFTAAIFTKNFQQGVDFTKFLMLPVSYIFASLYELDGSQIRKIVFINLMCIVVNIMLGIIGFGYHQYEAQYTGTRGFFYAGNDLSVVFVILSFFSLYIAWTRYSRYFYIALSAFLLFLAANIATKVSIFGIIILIAFFPLDSLNNIRFTKKNLKGLVWGLVAVLVFIIVVLQLTSLGGLLNRTADAMYRYSGSILSTLLSGRNIKLKREFVHFADEFSFTKLLFGSKTKIVIEMDLFDAFFNYGMVGVTILLFICIYGIHIYKIKLNKDGSYYYKKLMFLNYLILLISFVSGHVFFSATVNVFISLINVYCEKCSVQPKGNRIFLISNMYPNREYPFYGVFVKNTEEVLRQRGYVTTLKAVITKSKGSALNKIKLYLKFYIDILKGIFKAEEYDIIYVHFISHSAIPVLLLKLVVNKPLVLNTHGSDVFLRGRLAKILGFCSFLVSRVAEKVVVPSEFFREVVIRKLTVPPEKIIVYPSGGIDTKVFKYVPKQLENSELVLGYVSRMSYLKGCDIFVEIIKKLIQVLPSGVKVKGIMIGDGEDRERCLALIKDYGLEETIEYLGSMTQDEIAKYYPKFDLFVFPTRLNESLGLVGLEAMACGTPVVASAIGGIKTYIKHGQNGYLVDVDNVDGFIEVICKYINLSKEEKERIITNAYQTALRYEREKVISSFVTELQNVKDKDCKAVR